MKPRQPGRKRVGVRNRDGCTIGLDIGATAVRGAVVKLTTGEGRPSAAVQRTAEVPLAPGVLVNGVVQEPELLTTTVKRLWRQGGFTGRQVILGIANPQVLVRSMTIPDLDPRRRAQALPFQAREVVALPVDQVVLDFCQLGPADPETKLVNGLLLATPRQPVLDAVAAVERAGLNVARVDLSSFGAMRSIASEDPTVEAVVDLGAQLTTVVIHDRGVPKLVRTLARGGHELTTALADRLDISEEDAEMIKCEVGLDDDRPETTRVLAEALRPLMAEIRTSVQYFRTSNDLQITRMSLTGGGSALRGLPEALEQQTRISTRVVDPMQHVVGAGPTPDRRPVSAVALGLALGTAA